VIHVLPPAGRNVGKRMDMIRHASHMAKNGQRIMYLCPKVTEQLHRELILQHNHGAWPIGLRIQTVGE